MHAKNMEKMIVNPYGGDHAVNPPGATSGCERAKFTLPMDGWEDIRKPTNHPLMYLCSQMGILLLTLLQGQLQIVY